MKTNIFFIFLISILNQIYALFNNSYYSNLEQECIKNILNCTQSKTLSLLEPIDQAPIPNSDIVSRLLYHTPYISRRDQVLIDEDFLETFYLLYNNPNQLHTLLSLIKDSESGHNWLGFLNNFERCLSDNTLLTCRDNVCKSYSYEKLKFTGNIFVENIIGFEFNIPSNMINFNMSILIYLENEETRTQRIVRIDHHGINVFDALLNCLRYFSRYYNFSFPLIQEMEKYNEVLPFRSEFSNLLIRTY